MAGRRTALLVATDTYSDATFRKLRAPLAETEALAAVLADPQVGGYEVTVLHNTAAHEVTLAIEGFFAEARLDDLALLYVSGHGVKDDAGRLYLAATNSRHDRLGSTAVPALFIRNQMDYSRCRRIVMWLDCCYAGAFPPGAIHRAGESVDVLGHLGGRGCAVMTSSSALEYAFETGDSTTVTGTAVQSVFTSALIEGLRTGAADLDQDGLIDIDELYDYTYERVRARTPQQTPTLDSRFEGKLYVATSTRPPPPPPALPTELEYALRSPLPSVRGAVVGDLLAIAAAGDPATAPAAKAALTELTEDDSRLVAAAAVAALDQLLPPVTPLDPPAAEPAPPEIPVVEPAPKPPPPPAKAALPVRAMTADRAVTRAFADLVRRAQRRPWLTAASGVLSLVLAVSVSFLPLRQWSGTDSPSQSTAGALGALDKDSRRPNVEDIGEVKVGVRVSPAHYNSRVKNNRGSASSIVNALVLPSPFFVDLVEDHRVFRLDGDLMESVRQLDDAKEIEWKIRPEAKWSDGNPVSCKDFYLSWLAVDRGLPASQPGSSWEVETEAGYEQISKITCSDGGKTVLTTMRAPFAEYRLLFSAAGQDPLLPAHIVEQQAGIADITKIALDQNDEQVKKAKLFYAKGWKGYAKETSPSAGPYQVVSHDLANGTTVLERNAQWWANKGAAARITVQAVADQKQRLQSLTEGKLDATALNADDEQVKVGTKVAAFKVFSTSGPVYDHIDFNLARPLFKDNPVLLEAVARCVNRQQLVDQSVKAVDGWKPLGNLLLLPGEDGYEDHYTDIGRGEAAAAQELLLADGWKLGGDGILVKGAQRAAFQLGYLANQDRPAKAAAIQASCKQAGIEVKAVEDQQFISHRLTQGDFDAALFGWTKSPCQSCTAARYLSKEAGGTLNYSGYANRQVDQKYQQLGSESDPERRKRLINEIDRLIRDDHAFVPLFAVPEVVGFTGRVGPVSHVADQGDLLWNVFAWKKN